ncbi:MAG TPA: radical SAM protein [Candidatus Dojkabacteria bacterium]|nr:radical SAM protein [Candidatus Dojkabacteria bacterium]
MRCNSCDGIYDSLDVRFTKACDNNCPFCIEHDGLSSFGETNVPALIESTLSSGIKNVLILGGEPFLNPEKLRDYIIGIRPHVSTIYITTSLPKTVLSPYLKEIMENIDGLNVSIQDTHSEKNNKIMNASSNHNRLDILRELNQLYKDKIRVNLNLVKGGLDTRWDLVDALIRLEVLFDCAHVKINELQNSEDYISYEDIMGEKLPSPFSHGCQTPIDINGINMKLTLKRSCYNVEKSRKASLSDVVKELLSFNRKKYNKFGVMYENGLIRKGW